MMKYSPLRIFKYSTSNKQGVNPSKSRIGNASTSLLALIAAALLAVTSGCTIPNGPVDSTIEDEVARQMEFNRRTTGNPYHSIYISNGKGFMMYTNPDNP